jgi:hypothetical protein
MFPMRSTVLALALLTVPAAFAIDTRSHPIRIAILAPAPQEMDRRDQRTSNLVRGGIGRELRGRGYDADVVRDGFDDVQRGGGPRADYYVEVSGWADTSGPVVGVGVPVTPSVAAQVEVLVSRVAASLRVYDARTLEVVYSSDLSQNRAAVAPGIGVGGRAVWAYFALPFVEWTGHRLAANGVARQAALEIDEALRH